MLPRRRGTWRRSKKQSVSSNKKELESPLRGRRELHSFRSISKERQGVAKVDVPRASSGREVAVGFAIAILHSLGQMVRRQPTKRQRVWLDAEPHRLR